MKVVGDTLLLCTFTSNIIIMKQYIYDGIRMIT